MSFDLSRLIPVTKRAFAIALLVLIISIPVMKIQEYYFPGEKGAPHKYWISTIIISMLAHYIQEFSGINKYYCEHGNACITHSGRA